MRKWVLAIAAGTAWLVSISAASADPAAAAATRAGPWVLTGSTTLPAATANQGPTTVTRAGHSILVTRGSRSVARDLAAHGWTHIGDPGSFGGSVLDAYQSSPSTGAKLFTLTTAAGTRYDYLHRLAPGEMSNNSFAAVAPGGRWFVAGEWKTMSRLLVFAMPHPTASRPARASSLPLAATITLTHPVRDVQGCAFTSPTSLICSTNDPGTDLYPAPRQLLSVQLTRPLDGRPVRATPHLLGVVPPQLICAGPPGEVEGLDVRGNRMLVAVNAPCAPSTQLFSYTAPAPGTRIIAHASWIRPASSASAVRPRPATTTERERS